VPTFRITRSIHWVDGARYLGVTLDTRLTWSTRIDQVRKKVVQRLGVLRPLLKRRSGLSIRNGVLLHISGNCKCFNPSVFALLPMHFGTLVICKFMRIWGFFLYRPHQTSERFDSNLADVGKPLITQLGRYLADRALSRVP